MAQQEQRHLTTEQLSALLDKQLSPEEQKLCDAHLSTCQQCQQVLADLRQTVALVRALPQPKLPRSFALPVTTPVNPSSNVTPITQGRRQGLMPYYLRSTVRAMSTLAAVVGIIFLLSGVLGPLLSGSHGGTSTSDVNNGPVSHPNVGDTTPALTPNMHASATCGKVVKGTCVAEEPSPAPSPSPTPASIPNRGQSPPGDQGNPSSPVPPLLYLSTPGARLGVGAILLALGVLGFMLTNRRRRLQHNP